MRVKLFIALGMLGMSLFTYAGSQTRRGDFLSEL